MKIEGRSSVLMINLASEIPLSNSSPPTLCPLS
ncbi:hypothetical protein F383_38490 [Gossypium arboreum]|uniref:Uncharacterized protein n=1 Tax=Gossypium arboreum TaxID=29729 RepID=A0A0B0MJ94_GOSAR|nr:hypothetical protein F383_38490 [Gossypium arboreum]